MKSASTPLQSPPSPKGLCVEIARLLREWLSIAVKLRIAADPLDYKRMIRPQELPGSFSISIEPYKGFRTWVAIENEMRIRIDIPAADETIRKLQPELLGYVTHCSGSMLTQDTLSLLAALSESVIEYMEKGNPQEESISTALQELDALMSTRSATLRVFSPISGIVLPADIESIELDEGVILRRLTPQEITEMASHDITAGSRYDFITKDVTSALIISQNTGIDFSVVHNSDAIDHAIAQNVHQIIETCLCAIHLTKAGRFGILASFHSLIPSLLPGMKGYSTSPIIVNPPNKVDLSNDDLSILAKNYKLLVGSKREEIRIAATRLMDAESRFSPADALLDSVIGLEMLLTTGDGNNEASFRIALNYSMLGDLASRRSRYEDLSKIQKTRGDVVHGRLNLKSSKASLIFEHSELAKKCLRDALSRFINDSVLAGHHKLNKDFWLDKVIPSI